MTKKGYIVRGIIGWRVGFWDGRDVVRFVCGFTSWATALGYLRDFWNCPPDFQDGFCTIVRLGEDS